MSSIRRWHLNPPPEELYHSAKDPNQMQNPAGNPSCQNIRPALRDKLMGEPKANGDPRLKNEFDQMF